MAMLQVTAGVIASRGRVLVCQRLPAADHPGKWEFPGGKRAENESLQDCLHRELHEELGIDAAIGAEIWQTQHTYPGREPIALHFFLVAEFRGNLVNRAFAAIQWRPLGSLSALDFLEADRPVVQALDCGELQLETAPPASRRPTPGT